MTFPGVVRGNGNEIVHTQLPGTEGAPEGASPSGFFFFFLPPLRVLTQMTSGIQTTDHWEKEKNMPNSRDCSRICWWQGLPVTASAPPPSLNKGAKSLGFCRRPLGRGKPGPFILPLSACSCVYTTLFSLMHIPRLPLIHSLRNVYGNSL